MISRKRWAGGYNYQYNLFNAIDRHGDGNITPVVFAGQSDDDADLQGLGRIPGLEIARSVAFDPENSRSISPIVLGQDFAAISEFRKSKIDAVFESARFFGWRAPFPCIAWIPDMQH